MAFSSNVARMLYEQWQPFTGSSPYGPIELLIRAFSCVATYATFHRVLAEQNLSSVFLVLSLTPCVLLVLRLVPQFKREVALLSTITGLAVGVIGGFLSETVGYYREAPVRKSHESSSTISIYAQIVRHLELLHIPVLAGSITYTYCLFFLTLPSFVRCRLLFLVAFSATIALSMGAAILTGDVSLLTSVGSFLFLLVIMCLAVAWRVVKRSQRPWLACIACVWCWLNWQNRHFDYLSWDLSRPRFAVPACMTGTIIIFFVQPYKPTTRHRPLFDGSEEHRQDVMLNGVVWFCIAYIVERFSLTMVKARKYRGGEMPPTSDVWICNALIIAYMFVVSPNLVASVNVKLLLIIWGICIYAGVCLIYHCLHNAIFIDCILGLTLIFVMGT